MKLFSALKKYFFPLPSVFFVAWFCVEIAVILIIDTIFFPLELIDDDDSEYEIDEEDSDDDEADFDIEERNLGERLLSLPIIQSIDRVYYPTQSLFVNAIGQVAIHLFSIMIAKYSHKFLDVAVSSFMWGIKIKNHRDYAEVFDGFELYL